MFGYLSLNTEIFLCTAILFILLISVILQDKLIKFHYKLNLNKIVNNFTILTLLFSSLILFHNIYYESILLNYQLISDKLGYFGKYFILLMSCLYFIVSSDYYEYEKIKNFEHILLLLLAILGIFSIISSYDLITMYLSIELQSLCFYIVTNIKYYSNFSIEAGLKYFILGALSSGILLFGCSLIYGFTGMTNFSDLMVLFYYYNLEDFILYYYKLVLIGIICLYCALLFKIGVVPFHMWISDIYEGSPTNITLFFAVIPQLSIFILLIRLNLIFLYAYLHYLYIFFMFISILSIIIGTIGAFYQTKLKRILAYSSISNMGYILSMLSTLNIESLYSIIFYIIVYNMISFGLWTMLLIFRNKSNYYKFKDVSDLFLLYNSNKYLYFFFIILLFSAMGIPPLLGFFSKLYLLLNLIELKMFFMALFIIIFNSIGIIYFLRLIVVMSWYYKSNKYIYMEDSGEWRTLILILLLFVNIYFFLYPTHFAIFIHNLILYMLF